MLNALKRTPMVAERPGMKTGSGPVQAERRRSARWKAYVPVFVYGHTYGLTPFHEQAYSTSVSAMGARLIMTAKVRPGQTLLLTNKVTEAKERCRVAYVTAHDAQNLAVAVEFLQPAPNFWRVTRPRQEDRSFPPTGRSGS